ncbi:type IV pilus modification protein PilV [Piscinibacter sp.]|uniref:type IV pilus modification protein PilV n=1 Tax=Piscinibacter sp. TaxID=1903157 RepID=UPI002CF72113|nr:type IV pilus modification protein PilV [Albitalea sp.]HUG23254.1 type IV pilus modification protein PilV [Albitalea sp.]
MSQIRTVRRARRVPATARSLRGSALIEVLVAILVLSIGMLGIAGLQASSLRFSQGSWARAALASELSDLADRVRTNPGSGANAYQLASTYETQRGEIDDLEVAKDCETAACSADELAAFHLVEWRLALNRNLPGATGFVTGSRDTGYIATILWFDKELADEPETCEADFDGVRDRNCCPEAADVADIEGVRCTNMVVVP